MERLKFSPDGKLFSVDNKQVRYSSKKREENIDLMTSDSLEFLKEDEGKKLENIFDKTYWSLYEDNQLLKPLKFSNGKTQEDVVKEIVELIKSGEKVIFLHGVCGTGKSAIALNIARVLGKTSIVVPIKSLQKQYEGDYMGKKYLLKKNGKKMKIAMITGRENHDSLIEPGRSCAWPYLPDTIKITDKNSEKLKSYYKENPFVSAEIPPPVKNLRRISVAPANPYWSPIVSADIELNQLKDARKKKYEGMFGRQFIFYHRKEGCSYYDQYLSYFDSDVIIFNSAKYLAEVALARKPRTEVEIIDEADEFLDKLSDNVELNLTRLSASLKMLIPENEKAKQSIRKILTLIELEETNKRALGIDENKIYQIDETKIGEILRVFLSDIELETEIEVDEMNYGNTALEAAKDFSESFENTYLTYRKDEEGNIHARLVNMDLAQKFKKLVEGNNALVLMSGTLHSDEVLKHIFGIEKFVKVDAETLNQGSIELFRTGKEFDCKYSNFKNNIHSREDYLIALSKAIEKAKKPALVHVNAFSDLPDDNEVYALSLNNLVQKEELQSVQESDRNGDEILSFKKGKKDTLFTTKCSRGIDFPGAMCNSVVFTKYPNPNVKDTFWKILQRTHPNYYWEFYRDKARRDFLQRIYRAVRSKDDHVYVLSPDSRVLDAVRQLQEMELQK